jgi:excisionase family DNA binding protein
VTRLLTAQDVAARLQVPTTWVYRAAREGDLPFVACGRYRRFTEADIAAWIERRTRRERTA